MASKYQVYMNVQFLLFLTLYFLHSGSSTHANMNSPVFPKNSYDLDINEDFPVFTPFLTVIAIDDDAGDNGRVEYSFGPTTSSWYLNQFQLDEDTGELSLKQPLDFESVTEYNFVIVAIDKAPNPRSTFVNVVLRIVDINDNFPEISINTFAGNMEAELSENLPASTFIAHVSVFDIDSGENGKVSCDLGHSFFALLPIYRNEYQIVTSGSIDRERVDRFTLEVDCQDQGNPSLSTSETFTVNVLDENDNPPEFLQSKYSVALPENTKLDEHIITVSAIDRDSGPNADVRYYIMEPYADQYITVDEISGEIRTRAIFDYEYMYHLVFIVIASDQGERQLSATTTVEITITDTNDEAPEFDQTHYSFSVLENNPINEIVGRVIAVDQDSSAYNAFVYSMTMVQPADQGTFHIDEISGQIMTLRTFDREEKSLYHMTVFAADTAIPSLVGSASVTVYVADKNDNWPSITFPDRHNNTFAVSAHVPVGHVITRVSAGDRDIGANAHLIFSVSSGDSLGLFAIDALIGTLSVAENLRDLDYGVYTIQIHVSASGHPAKSVTTAVSIVVV